MMAGALSTAVTSRVADHSATAYFAGAVSSLGGIYLRCAGSADKTVFMNETGEAVTFPDRLTITLFIIGPLPLSEFAQPKRLDAEYMLGLRFSANWKRGVKMRPVKAFRELTASESQPPDFAVPLNARQCWIYEFAVEDTNVPLTDHLILCIFSPENKRLARLSAHF